MLTRLQEVLLMLCCEGGECSRAKIALLMGSVVAVFSRPGRAASSNPASRFWEKRTRHLQTRAGRVSNRSAIALLLKPSAIHRMMRARSTWRDCAFGCRSQDSSWARSILVRLIGVAGRAILINSLYAVF